MHKPKDKGELEGVGFKIRLLDFIHCILLYSPVKGLKITLFYTSYHTVYSPGTKADIPEDKILIVTNGI